MKILKIAGIVIAVTLLGILYATGNWSEAIYDTNVNGGNYESMKVMDEDTEVVQTFICQNAGLNGFRVRFSTLNRQETGNYEWELREAGGQEPVAQGDVDFSKINGKGEYRVSFPKQEESENKRYELTIRAQDVPEEQAITLYRTTPKGGAEKLTMEGEKTDGSIILKIYCHRFHAETFIVFCCFIAYLAAFILFMSKLFK